MNQHHRDRRKINPSRGPRLADGSPNDNDRMEIGPTRLAQGEWAAAGLEPPDLDAMRRHRWERLTAHVVERDWGGVLLFDPLNIRYATDHSNMQLWNTHNPFRAVLLCADGHMVLWDYRNSPFLADHLPLGARGPLGRVLLLLRRRRPDARAGRKPSRARCAT